MPAQTSESVQKPINQNVPIKPPKRSKRSQKKSKPASYRWLSFLSVGIAFSLWFLATNLGWVESILFPSPQAVWAAFTDILANNYKGNLSLAQHTFASMQRLFIAFALAFVLAVPLGLASGYFKPVRAIFDPFIEFYRPLPPLAYYTLLVLWLGIENESKIALLFLAGFAPLYIAMIAGVERVPRDRINAALSLGASQWQPTFRPFDCHIENKGSFNIIGSIPERQNPGRAVFCDDFR